MSKSVRGFTLVETVIYIGLFGAILSVGIIAFYQILGSQNQNVGRLEVEEEANFIMGKLRWALGGAKTILEPTSGATSSVLSLEKFNFNQNPLVFSVANGNMLLRRGSNPAAPLNSGNVAIKNVVFEHLGATGTDLSGIKVSFSVVSKIAATTITASTTLENTVYLKK